MKNRKYYILKIVDFYKSEFGEHHVPHIYSIGIFAVFDFLYILSFFIFFTLETIEYFSHIVLTISLIMNFLIYKFVKLSDVYTPKPFLIYSYFIFGVVLIIAVSVGNLNIEIWLNE